MKLSQVFISS